MTTCHHCDRRDLLDQVNTSLSELNETLAKRGERVLGMAHFILPSDKYTKDYKFDADLEPPNFPVTGLVFVGFISLIDPPRLSVKPAI